MGNLGKAIDTQRQFINQILILLDADIAGKDAAESLEKSHRIDKSEIRLIPREKRHPASEVELEDIIQPNFIASALNEKFGNSFKADDFENVKTKWSNNFKRAAQTSGIHGIAIDSAKTAISIAVEKHGITALRTEYRDYIERLAQTLEGMLDEVNEGAVS